MKNVSLFCLALVATALSCRGEVVGQKDQRLAGQIGLGKDKGQDWNSNVIRM